MNQLNVSLQNAIVTLSGQGWSARKIARQLGLNRETIGRYLRRAAERSKPAIPPVGFPNPVSPKPAIVPPGSMADRTSQCAPLREVIQKGREAGLSTQSGAWKTRSEPSAASPPPWLTT